MAAPDHSYSVTNFLRGNQEMFLFEASWQGDSGTGAVANVTIPAADLKRFLGRKIIAVITDPGATAPTADYDIVVNDIYGVDVMAGNLANRHTSASEIYQPTIPIPIYGQLTAVFTNQSVNSALGKLVFIIK